MKHKLIVTADDSHTVFVEELNEHYHSTKGALNESLHVFIEAGLKEKTRIRNTINVLEIGFGTSLNVLLSMLESDKEQVHINYKTIEAYPLDIELVEKLNYPQIIGGQKSINYFREIHALEWNKEHQITPKFIFEKIKGRVEDIQLENFGDVIYFDAFAPNKQPELWTEVIFRKMYGALKEDGILTTYCAQGDARRSMTAAGFRVEKLPGPPGKREMVRAWK